MQYTQAQMNAAIRSALEALTGQTSAHSAAPKEEREAILCAVKADGETLTVTATGSGWAAPDNCWSAEFKVGDYGVKVYHYGWTNTQDTIVVTPASLDATMTKKAQDFLFGADGKPRAGIADKRGARPTRDCAWRVSAIVRA